MVLSLLVHVGKPQEVSKEHAFELAREKLGGLDIALLPANEIRFDMINASLDHLAQLAPLKKPQVLKACASAIVADQQVTDAEAELFRAIADLIDCPMPPLVG